jgi:hypothetical protein
MAKTHFRIAAVCLGYLSVGLVFGQPIRTYIDEIPVVSVCEALDARRAYNGKAVIVIGKQHDMNEGSWLGEGCPKNIVNDGYTWDNIIALPPVVVQHGLPAPELPKTFNWENAVLREKMKFVQMHTKRRDHDEVHSERWAAWFGRFETMFPLRVVKGGRGDPQGAAFGHDGASPAQLVCRKDAYRWLERK